MNSYYYAITITPADKIGPLTVGHLPLEISRFVQFFWHEGGVISGNCS